MSLIFKDPVCPYGKPGLGVSKNVPLRLLVTRFEARNCIGDPGPQELYQDIFLKHPMIRGARSITSRSWIRILPPYHFQLSLSKTRLSKDA
jgi:hypothetical protein